MIEKISVVIPTLNEEKTIAKVINELQKSKYISEIIVIDNNSKDNSAKISKENNAKVVFCEEIGFGYALKKGIIQAENRLIFNLEDLKNKNIGNIDYKVLNERLNLNKKISLDRNYFGPGLCVLLS